MKSALTIFKILLTLTALTLSLSTYAKAKNYRVTLNVELNPTSAGAEVALKVEQKNGQLKELDFLAPANLFTEYRATKGKIRRKGSRITWQVPKQGGRLRWHASLNVPKNSSYDARITDDWAILRFEDLFPPLTSRAAKEANSIFRLQMNAPKYWSIETRYGRVGSEPIKIESKNLNFDRPTGWLIAGKLGVRRDTIEGRDITIAAPVGSRYSRIPTLAFLRWTLPEFTKAFPSLHDELLIVSGGEDMWRGALSGPNSLFMHIDRPVVSENSTSTLLHELVHVATKFSGAPKDDWIVEGLAEYYSLEILRRSDGISQQRFNAALETLQTWATEEDARLADPSKGADTAFAALLFHEIAQELRQRKDASDSDPDTYPLDQAIRHLLKGRMGKTEVSRNQLQSSIKATSGSSSKELIRHLKNQAAEES